MSTSRFTQHHELTFTSRNGAVGLQRTLIYNHATMNDQDSLTIEAFQKHIHDRYFDADSARGTAATFLWFIEEIGELATALHTAQRTGKDRSSLTISAGDAPSNGLDEEFADVLAWLCTLANINHVNLADAVRKKYLTAGGPQGHK